MKKSRILAGAGLGLLGVVLGSPSMTGTSFGPLEARADTTAVAPIGTGTSCVLKGTSPIVKDTPLFDAPTGGNVIARFTGNVVPMQMTEIPADAANGRAKLKTSTGSGSVRIEGYVKASVIPAFTTRDVPVMAGNIWIASAQKVQIVHASPGSVTVERVIAATRKQTVRGTTTCDALALEQGKPTPADVPQTARTFLTKESTTDIYDRPNGDILFSLQMIEGSSQHLWSTETKAGFVHIKSRSDLVIDGWVRWKDLDPIKRGEMMGSDVQPPVQLPAVKLVFDSPPRVATATKDIPIRAKPNEKAKPIGVVETGAQVYVRESNAGWTNVLPKSVHVLPPDEGGFWIPSSEVPK
jgi:hypothetical protein